MGHEDMVDIDPKVSSHYLKIDPTIALRRQKRRALNLEKYEALKEEVQKLTNNGFIRETVAENGSKPNFGEETQW